MHAGTQVVIREESGFDMFTNLDEVCYNRRIYMAGDKLGSEIDYL